jgi:hypothetical protein
MKGGQMDPIEAVDKERSEQKFTVLKRWGGSWSERNIRHLSRLKKRVSTHSDFPEFVIIYDEVPRKAIMDAVGKHFNRIVVTGFDNPRLPFMPPE